MNDRELLSALYTFLLKQNYVLGDETGIKDMVLRYQQPPLTMLHRVAMRMSVNDYNKLAQLMKDIEAHLKPVEFESLTTIPDGSAFSELNAKQINEIASSFGIGNKPK